MGASILGATATAGLTQQPTDAPEATPTIVPGSAALPTQTPAGEGSRAGGTWGEPTQEPTQEPTALPTGTPTNPALTATATPTSTSLLPSAGPNLSPIPPTITPEPVAPEEPEHPVDCTGTIGREIGLENCGGGGVGWLTGDVNLGNWFKGSFGGVSDNFCVPHPNADGNFPCDEHRHPIVEGSPGEKLVSFLGLDKLIPTLPGPLAPLTPDPSQSGAALIPGPNWDFSPSGTGEEVYFIGAKGVVHFGGSKVKGSYGPGILFARHHDAVEGRMVSVGIYMNGEVGLVAAGEGFQLGVGAAGYLTFKDPFASDPNAVVAAPTQTAVPVLLDSPYRQGQTGTPTATATATPTATPTATATATPTAVPTAQPVPAATALPDDAMLVVPTAAATAVPTVAPAIVPAATPALTPTNTPSMTPTPTPSPTLEATPPSTGAPAERVPSVATPAQQPAQRQQGPGGVDPLLDASRPPVDQPVNQPVDQVIDPVSHEVIGTCRDGACGLNMRTAPQLDAAVAGVALEGQTLKVVCQTTGAEVGNGRASSKIWNRLSDGTYVSDFYLDTERVGEFSPSIPRC